MMQKPSIKSTLSAIAQRVGFRGPSLPGDQFCFNCRSAASLERAGNRFAVMRSHLAKIQDWEALALQAKFRPAVMAALRPICLRQMERFFRAKFQKTSTKWIRELGCRLARQLVSQGWHNKAVEGWPANGDSALTVFAPRSCWNDPRYILRFQTAPSQAITKFLTEI